MAEKLLLQAKCEDGEHIDVVTEWELSAEKVIGAFMALGIKIGVDLCGEKAHVVYEEFEKAFRQLKNEEKIKEILDLMKGE